MRMRFTAGPQPERPAACTRARPCAGSPAPRTRWRVSRQALAAAAQERVDDDMHRLQFRDRLAQALLARARELVGPAIGSARRRLPGGAHELGVLQSAQRAVEAPRVVAAEAKRAE